MSGRQRGRNRAASIRSRLRALARECSVEFQVILSEYATERFLYRLGASQYAEEFVLKGATLFRLWSGERGRATWDLDLLGYGESGVEDTVSVIRVLCEIVSEDGLAFIPESVIGEEIRASDKYAGVRVRLEARLAKATIPVQVDVGFGDAVVPAPVLQDYPTLLGQEAPRILVYPREAVVAEKLEAILSLGVTNSRMKDFYDIHRLLSVATFDGSVLSRSIGATFLRRGTPFPEGEPQALTPGFLAAPERQTQWRAFLRRGRLEAPEVGGDLTTELRRFLLPVLKAAAQGERFEAFWRPGGPWQPGWQEPRKSMRAPKQRRDVTGASE